jgi:DNA-binding CsgD family transcriptional regulator
MTDSAVVAGDEADDMPSETLIGRDDERTLLRGTVRAGGALVVTGEFGVGKTALLTAARDEAVGARVLAGADLARLLAPVRDRLDVVPGPLRGVLAGALGLGPAMPAAPLLLGNAVLVLLRTLAEERPILIVADDLHRMDELGAATLAFTARRLRGPGVTVLASVNSTVCGDADLYGLPRLDLAALTGDEVDELLTRRFPEMAYGVRRRLRGDARGNPYAALSFAAALDRPQRRGARPLPSVLAGDPTSGDLLSGLLGALPSATRKALLMAALDDTGDLAVLNAASAYGQALAVLEPAERARLVSVDEEGRRLDFTHPLTRSVIVARASRADRRRAHGTLASVLADIDPPRSAWHLAEAASSPDDEVSGALEQAARVHLGSGRPRAAWAAMARAAALAATPELRCSRLAEASYLDALMVNVPSRPAPVAAGLVGAIAQAYRDSYQDPGAGGRLFARALREADGPEPPVVREAMHALSILAVYADEPELWAEFEGLLARYADEVPPSVRIFVGAFGPGRSGVTPGEVDAFLDGMRHEVNPALVLRAGLTLTYLNRMGGAREPIGRCVTEGEADGAVAATHRALSILGLDAWAAGTWDEGERIVERATTLAAETGYVGPNSPLLAAVRGLIAAVRGIRGTTTEAVAELDFWAGERRSGLARQFAGHIRCLDALSRGDPEAAYGFASDPAELRPYRPHAAWLAFDLVESAVRSGRYDRAGAHVKALRDWPATPLSARLPFVLAGCEALVAPSAELFEHALAVPGAEQWPFELARVELTYGEHLRAHRDLRGARLHLSNALRWFDRLQATPWSARAAELVRTTGSGRGEPAGIATLTPVELRMATLAAAGLTNKEIGDRLFLSDRTVSTYLHAMFPKLGVSTRAALADALARRTSTP